MIALLLDLVQVPASTIVQDYTMTAELLTPLLPSFREKARLAGLDEARHEKLMECRAEAMEMTVAYLHSQHGGAETYLCKLGLSDAQIEKIRGRVVGSALNSPPASGL